MGRFLLVALLLAAAIAYIHYEVATALTTSWRIGCESAGGSAYTCEHLQKNPRN